MKNITLELDDIYNYIVPSYFKIGEYEVVVLQDPYGTALTIRIQEWQN